MTLAYAFAALVAGVLVGTTSAHGVLVYEPAALAPLLIQGSAALIALAWPAAQLANNWLAETGERFATAVREGTLPANVDLLERQYNRVAAVLNAGRAGVGFAGCAVISGVLALILPDTVLHAGACTLTLPDLGTGLAMTMTATAFGHFIAIAWRLFDDNAAAAGRNALAALRASEQAHEPGPRPVRPVDRTDDPPAPDATQG